MHVLDVCLAAQVLWIDDSDGGRFGNEIAEHADLLLYELRSEEGSAGEISTRPVQVSDKAQLDRIATTVNTMGIVLVANLASWARIPP